MLKSAIMGWYISHLKHFPKRVILTIIVFGTGTLDIKAKPGMDEKDEYFRKHIIKHKITTTENQIIRSNIDISDG